MILCLLLASCLRCRQPPSASLPNLLLLLLLLPSSGVVAKYLTNQSLKLDLAEDPLWLWRRQRL